MNANEVAHLFACIVLLNFVQNIISFGSRIHQMKQVALTDNVINATAVACRVVSPTDSLLRSAARSRSMRRAAILLDQVR